MIGLHIQFGLVDPLLGDDEPLLPPPDQQRCSGGLNALRESIVHGCILGFVGSVANSGTRSPSLERLTGDPDSPGVVKVLKMRAIIPAPDPETHRRDHQGLNRPGRCAMATHSLLNRPCARPGFTSGLIGGASVTCCQDVDGTAPRHYTRVMVQAGDTSLKYHPEKGEENEQD